MEVSIVPAISSICGHMESDSGCAVEGGVVVGFGFVVSDELPQKYRDVPEVPTSGVGVLTGLNDGRRAPWWVADQGDLLRWLDGSPLLRQMAMEGRFRWVVMLLGFLVGVLMLGLFRIWVVTPPGFQPTIRISGLDYVQARHHGWRSRKAWAGRDVESSLFEWRQALANHPASVSLLRVGLERMVGLPADTTERFQLALGASSWLLRLTETNDVDVDLALRVYESLGLDDWILETVSRVGGSRTPLQYAAMLKARFRCGDMEGFDRSWVGETGRADLDRELDVYRTVWKIGWGDRSKAVEAEGRLAAMLRGPMRRTALRLGLVLLARDGDLLGYERQLADLEAMGGALPSYHVAHWRLLSARGRLGDARKLAGHYSTPPVTSAEMKRVAKAFVELGLEEDAIAFLNRYLPELGSSLDGWQLQAELLFRRRRWTELQSLGVRLRDHPRWRGRMDGYGFFVEGLCLHMRGALGGAAAAFWRVSSHPVQDSATMMEMVSWLVRFGYDAAAHELLLALESEVREDPCYWELRCQIAWRQGDLKGLRRATGHCWRLRPGDLGAADALAAAWAMEPADPGLVLELTERVLAGGVGTLSARVHRSVALIRLRRTAEAEAILCLVDVDRVTKPTEKSLLRWARFEYYRALGRWEEAFRESTLIDEKQLFATERIQYRKLRRDLEIRLGLDSSN